MQEIDIGPEYSELQAIVVEASRSLAKLDTARLDELFQSCQALTRSLHAGDSGVRARLALEARDAKGDMAVLCRVLEATRANLNVMKRLRELRQGRLEYTERQLHGTPAAGDRDGHH